MAQLLGDDADFPAFFANLCGESVPQAVGVDLIGEAGSSAEVGQQAADVADAEILNEAFRGSLVIHPSSDFW